MRLLIYSSGKSLFCQKILDVVWFGKPETMSDILMVKIIPGTLIFLILLWKIEMNWRYRRALKQYFEIDVSADKAARDALDLKEAGLPANHPDFIRAVNLWHELQEKALVIKPW